MARIVVLSDIHLSPTHGFFWENWCVAREFADAAKSDAVIVNGDLAINGPDSDAEIAFAARALGKLRTRVMALPGNHDVGDEPPGQALTRSSMRIDSQDGIALLPSIGGPWMPAAGACLASTRSFLVRA